MHRPAFSTLIAQRICSSTVLAIFAGAVFAFPAGAFTSANPAVAQNNHQGGASGRSGGKTESRGLRLSTADAFAGFTLLSPLKDTKTYLLNMRGQVAHTWESDMPPGNSVYLRPNGNLVRAARPLNNPVFGAGGEGGRIREYSWSGELLWELDWNDESRLQHHDFELMPNGNLLLISWEAKSSEQAKARGRQQESEDIRAFFPDYLVEIKPTGKRGAEVVWEWHTWDHMVQNVDSTLQGYGNPAEFPGRININGDFSKQQMDDAQKARLQALGYLAPDPDDGKSTSNDGGQKAKPGDPPPPPPEKRKGVDWMHTNAVDYNADLDLIVISVRRMNEIWVIDHSTTSAEAATESGGRYGQGGALLYRWGNPQVYGRGTAEDQQLFGQHDAEWIPNGHPGAGHILVFDNGAGRPDGKYSRVLELSPTLQNKEFSMNDDGQYFPDSAAWSYSAENPAEFYSSFISGAQRLANGNTLICEGDKGRVFEVNEAGTIVWEYWNQFGERSIGNRKGKGPGGPPPKGGGGGGPQPKALFRATRIAADDPGLKFPDQK